MKDAKLKQQRQARKDKLTSAKLKLQAVLDKSLKKNSQQSLAVAMPTLSAPAPPTE